MRRWRLRAALILLAAAWVWIIMMLLASCSSPVSSQGTHISGQGGNQGSRPVVVSMQLPAHTSIGTGAQAQLWARAIVNQVVAKPTQADYASLVAWFGAEDAHKPGGAYTYGAGENNPLNLTAVSGDFPGVTGTEPSGAGPGHPGNLDFATPAQGVTATVSVIWVKYPGLARALTSGRGLLGNPAVAADLGRWSGGGYWSLP